MVDGINRSNREINLDDKNFSDKDLVTERRDMKDVITKAQTVVIDNNKITSVPSGEKDDSPEEGKEEDEDEEGKEEDEDEDEEEEQPVESTVQKYQEDLEILSSRLEKTDAKVDKTNENVSALVGSISNLTEGLKQGKMMSDNGQSSQKNLTTTNEPEVVQQPLEEDKRENLAPEVRSRMRDSSEDYALELKLEGFPPFKTTCQLYWIFPLGEDGFCILVGQNEDQEDLSSLQDLDLEQTFRLTAKFRNGKQHEFFNTCITGLPSKNTHAGYIGMVFIGVAQPDEGYARPDAGKIMGTGRSKPIERDGATQFI